MFDEVDYGEEGRVLVMRFEFLHKFLQRRRLVVRDVVGDGALEARKAKLAVWVRWISHL